ncbi:Switch protein [Lachnellula suecica]|uniref:Switch protein n=1 Tax=Lachnellula suecica TaxID=602035 RepID=A0A8T9CET3_9HELO|nr:Switch protein [Lachnellula suecica]
MSHLAQAEGYEDEQTADEEKFEGRHGRGSAVMSTNAYIERIVGAPVDDISDSDIEIPDVRPSTRKSGKRKAGERLQWSEGESDNPYEKFKNRKVDKKKRIAAKNKKMKERAKDDAKIIKKAKAKGEPVQRKERIWGDQSDDGILDDEVPDYVVGRRREFDQKYQKLAEAGLHLPPNYEDINFSDDERLADLEERPDFPATIEQSRPYKDIELPHSLGVIPASIAQYLRDYQVEGVAFLHELFVYQKGGVLGDDMGLGKTVQVAAFLTAAFGKTGDERDAKRMRKMRRARGEPWYPRVLIVCPGSLIQNWKNELERWGWWHVDKYHGDPQERDAVLRSVIKGRLEIIITTYHTYKNHKHEINEVNWDCVVADECHQLKERSSQVTQAMNEVNALCRIGLTGTAIQNKYEELWTLLNWTNPGRFGPLSTWNSSISVPLKMGQSHDATHHQLKNARETAKALVNNLLPEFFLRRMKSLIAHQLPKKTDKVVFCPLTELQQDAYERFLASDSVQYVRNSGEDCDCGSDKKRGWCCYSHLPDSNTKWQALVFPVIITLQKLSNHLALLIPNSADVSDKQERDLDFLRDMVPDRWRDLYAHRDSLVNLSNPEFCGKWRILRKLLKFWHDNGDKVLIFSHSVRLLKMLQHLFNNTSYNVSFLSGSMPPEDRQNTVDEFNTDPRQFVFLISTKAGGVGLNITSANKVVIFDPNWNPSYDLQAQDRAYRIGQLRDVEVFRLVSAGTVEEIVYARQIYKQQQANIGYNASAERRYFKGVQNAKGQKGEIFGLDNLLSFHGDNVVLRDIVNKTNVAEAKRGLDILEMNMDDAADDEDNPLKVDNDDNGDGAMSQLAALITEGEDIKKKKKKSESRPKTDAILQGILAAAGVQYTHENSEVVGSSKVEAELSRRAEETGNDVHYGEEKLFAESQSFASDPGRIQYQFHPPQDVMLRQFCSMAKTFKFDSATEFALIVEGWTQKQRRDCLERFYLKRKERMADLEAGNQPDIANTPVVDVPADSIEIDDETEDDEPGGASGEGAEGQDRADEDLLADILGNGVEEDDETEGDDEL